MVLKVVVSVTIVLTISRICSGAAVGYGMDRYHGYGSFSYEYDDEEELVSEEGISEEPDSEGGGLSDSDESSDYESEESDNFQDEDGPLTEEELMRPPTNADLALMANDIKRPAEGGPSLQQGYNWPGGLIAFQIDGGFEPRVIQMIHRSMNIISWGTCIRFKERTNEVAFVLIQSIPGQGCQSYIGRKGDLQILNLENTGQSSCWNVYTITHELIHAIGFDHEQNRRDRDNYVIINWNNIDPRRKDQFRINDRMQTFGIPYDLQSIMHYRSWEFSINGQPTISRKSGYGEFSGAGMTAYDGAKIRKKYGCY